jgi:hypothetical protein
MVAQANRRISVLARLLGLAVVVVAVLAAPAARADGLCIEDTQVEPDLGPALDRLVATAQVEVRSPGGCQAEGAGLVGRFSRRDPVLFTLHTRAGDKFSRAVPWLTRPDAALVRLRAQGRMSAFSVLVEGLLAEQRIAAGQAARLPRGPSAGAARAPAPPTAEPASSARPAAPVSSTRPALVRAQERDAAAQPAVQPEQQPAAPRAGDAPAAGEPEQPSPARAVDAPSNEPPAEPARDLPETPAAEPARDVAAEPAGDVAAEPAGDVPAGESTAGPVAARVAAARSRPASDGPAAVPQPPAPAAQPPTGSAAPSRPASQRVTVPLSGQPQAERSAGALPPVAAVQVRERSGSRIWPGLEALVAGRMRLPDLVGLELGAGVAWRSVFARASYQPSVRWDLDGRPIEVAAFAATAGFRPTAYRRGAWRLGPSLAMTLERLTVQRVDLQDTAVHPYWDPGVVIGAVVTRDMAGGLRMSLHVEACRSFGRTVRVPDGPEAGFNRLGARVGISIAWLP